MTYWDISENLHTDYARDFPQTQASVGAIRKIRSILEPHWKVYGLQEHPPSHVLMQAPRTEELVHLSRKLKAKDIDAQDFAQAAKDLVRSASEPLVRP